MLVINRESWQELHEGLSSTDLLPSTQLEPFCVFANRPEAVNTILELCNPSRHSHWHWGCGFQWEINLSYKKNHILVSSWVVVMAKVGNFLCPGDSGVNLRVIRTFNCGITFTFTEILSWMQLEWSLFNKSWTANSHQAKADESILEPTWQGILRA